MMELKDSKLQTRSLPRVAVCARSARRTFGSSLTVYFFTRANDGGISRSPQFCRATFVIWVSYTHSWLSLDLHSTTYPRTV